MARDARLHRSPNAGWPEAAMAGGLHVRLSGPRVYASRIANEPWVNAGAPDPTAADLQRGLALYARAMFVIGLGLAAVSYTHLDVYKRQPLRHWPGGGVRRRRWQRLALRSKGPPIR